MPNRGASCPDLDAVQEASLSLTVTPTPVCRAERLSRRLGAEIWVKQDDRTHPILGGNKVRKLFFELEVAREKGCRQLLTLGGVGSNHVAATAIHGRDAGFEVTAIVVQQPSVEGLTAAPLAALAAGATLVPSSDWAMPFHVSSTWAALRRKGPVHWIPPGGTTVAGALGYAHAVKELSAQIASGEAPFWPDTMVCAMGSGGMHAGLAAGAHHLKPDCRVLGVRVTDRWMVRQRRLDALTRGALEGLGVGAGTRCKITLDETQVGEGYGHPTQASREAVKIFADDGVQLDPVYTGKAAAAILARAQKGERWLFWNSLTVIPKPPAEATLPPALGRLFT